MRSQRLWMAAPYILLFAVAAWFYAIAGSIEYSRQGDNLGPDFWPRVVLAVLMAISAVQTARLLFFENAGKSPEPHADLLLHEEDGPRSYLLLGLGLGLTVAYGALLTSLGFLTATFLYMALFMYVGCYRQHRVIWISSFAGSVLLTLVFQKIVYVSLPRGIYPFDQLTDALLRLF